MTLDEYMKKYEIRNIDLAKDTGFTDGFISKLRKFKAVPTLINSFIISRACNFEVSIIELVSQGSFNDYIKNRRIENCDFKIRPFNLKFIFSKNKSNEA